MKADISTLFREYRSCFEVLNLLIAVRESSRKVVSLSGNLLELKSYFVEPEKIYSFLLETGLDEIFKDRKIKNLCDYVFGVEVGLDTNARKNRSGTNFANLISERFRSENICFQIF
ncbi:DpnII family type II restriction endonuclease [Campylobacter concisus]|uniref:DpnII family type II restriction endonuclease n=1 Tax=Campylobacter concisus TaxID=199 RepID=UPI0006864C8C|nr:DpnII family type II restriction endonuclease [Campylobacter concisus]